MTLSFRGVAVLGLLAFIAGAAPPPGYGDAGSKTGTALRQTLHAVIRNHTVIPYSSTSFDMSNALKILDEDPRMLTTLLYAARIG